LTGGEAVLRGLVQRGVLSLRQDVHRPAAPGVDRLEEHHPTPDEDRQQRQRLPAECPSLGFGAAGMQSMTVICIPATERLLRLAVSLARRWVVVESRMRADSSDGRDEPRVGARLECRKQTYDLRPHRTRAKEDVWGSGV